MAKQGEIEYLKKLKPEELWHAVNKPFSDAGCDGELMEVAAVMTLLPPPPARLAPRVASPNFWISIGILSTKPAKSKSTAVRPSNPFALISLPTLWAGQ